MNILGDLKDFNGRMKLQQAALAFISANMLTEQEKNQMKRIFQAIDKNLDGELSKIEVIQGLERLGMGAGNAAAQADRIFKQIDLDDNGTIEFDEWCRATMNKRKTLSKKRL